MSASSRRKPQRVGRRVQHQIIAGLAQLVEQLPCKHQVAGSTPAAGTSFQSPYVFVMERRRPLTTSAVRKIVSRAGAVAELEFPVRPHMLRQGCGYTLANAGHDKRAIQHYMGHSDIQYTCRYETNLRDTVDLGT